MTRGKILAWSLASTALLGLAACGSDDSDSPIDPPEVRAPNILLVIMDDVGIDQMTSFGYGGATPPLVPNMDAVAEAGLRFHNTWAMPVCSPARAAMFAGRYPFRTGLSQPIGPDDLANSQLSPYEVTIPQVLKAAGYESAMFGKFHLAGPDHNQAGNGTPAALGWDYFHGWIGLPEAIDTTAGGLADKGTYSCGFVPGYAQGGSELGACYYADNTCQPMQRTSPEQDAPGLQCVESGGLFVPDQSCSAPRPTSLNFTIDNAYYVSPLVIIEDGQVEAVPLDDPRARGYRTRIEADAAIEWINARKGSDTPWMASLTFTSAHTPLQTPPSSLLSGVGHGHTDELDCSNIVQGRVLQNRMTEAMDTEFGRVLVETGLATRNDDGTLNYHPEASNTVIVVITDNGTLAYSVKQPFDADRAKGTAYQTGVWVPLIIAGPQVEQPGRSVPHMVNQVDLFQFFGELAGIDVHQVVPRRVDSAPLLPYLTNPEQASLRSINFTMNGLGIQANGAAYGPCIMAETTCSQIPTSKSVCEDNQGVWWGPGYDHSTVVDNGGVGYFSCGEVNQALYLDKQPMVEIQAEKSLAIRDVDYKIVRNTAQHYDPETNTIGLIETEEFYRINQDVPNPLLDSAGLELTPPFAPDAQRAYDNLLAKLDTLLSSEPECPGDGNRDGVVDAQDLANWSRIAQDWGKSSVYDFPVNGIYDGLTNHVDGAIIQQNMGLRCPPGPRVY
ncbi:MAG: sulfatase-like hydrolase/transferase [Pigmentiphaga sp.]|nr:sulfatase-like hydrolase/transferase [Pigmentiphaga sp.]